MAIPPLYGREKRMVITFWVLECIFCPPYAVYSMCRADGSPENWRLGLIIACIILTILGWIPGVIFAFTVLCYLSSSKQRMRDMMFNLANNKV